MLLTMDVSLLSAPATEYTNQRTLLSLTSASANSPSGSLTRRSGVRRGRAEELEERRKQTGLVASSKRDGLFDGQDLWMGLSSDFQGRTTSGKGWDDEKEQSRSVSSGLSHNDKIDKKTTDFGINRSRNYNPASERQTGTEWRRSRSVDWRSGARSPDRGTRRSDTSAWSTEENNHGKKDTSGLRGGSMPSFRTSVWVSPVSSSAKCPLEQTLEAMDGGNSFPLRLKSASDATWDSRDLGSFGAKRGQSILERIEKLYGASKNEDFSKVRSLSYSERDRYDGKGVLNILPSSYDEATEGNFPRRGSAGERSYHSPTDTNGSFARPLLDISAPGLNNSPFPRTRARLPEGQWQERIYGRYSDIGGVSGGKEFMETMSLDRARSRNTIAGQIRMARTAQSNTLLEQTTASREGNGSMDLGNVNWEREKNDAPRINVTHRTFTPEKGNLTEFELMGSSENVFESHLHNSRSNTAESRVHPETQSSSISVRNKINQFEALTQRCQGSKTAMPRRAFSVPTRLYSAHDSLKRESRTGTRGDRYTGLNELEENGRKSEEKGGPRQLKNQSQRSLSVDEIGQKMEGPTMDRVNKYTVTHFSEYSKLKHTQKSENTQEHTNFYLDEPDHGKASSNKDRRSTNTDLPSDPDHPAYAKPGVIILSVADEDQTPTNSPNHSPSWSPVSLPIHNSSLVPTEKESQACLPTPVRPLASSSRGNLADLLIPDVIDGDAKGRKQMIDLDAWVAGWKAWRDDDDDSEDDDASTQKDGDSNYDSDSGESSVTITSNMSLSDRRSFSVSLAELCYFTGTDYESDTDDEWSAATVGNRRSASLSSDMSALSYVSVLPTEELDKLLEDVRGLRDSDLQDNVHVVVLHKEMAVGLGFSIAGGIDQNKPVIVHKVFPSGVAAQEGSIKEGDQVLSINGTALERHTHWEALRVLRRAKTREMGVVVLRRGGVRSISKGAVGPMEEVGPTQTSGTDQHMKVRLEKKSRDLGFSLEGGVGLGDKPLTIKKIFQGGPVDKICPGDEVMEIEGVSMVGMRRLEAWTLIRRLPSGPVDVVIRRPRNAPEL
uniref:uncharacterized protein si:dkey-92i15.4 isoform X2 n=1 Tax=Doryrhamphus excisus TaxID=161450 RepID=UPI0025AE45C6|nr:uncharacterized protein si:dkey-92i15.4 isoform X2 [Doryrhamphus excisus]